MVSAMQTYTLFMNAEERAVLLRLLDQAVRDIHSEARRTENPSFRETIRDEEMRLRNLADKIHESSLNLLRGPAAL